MANYNYNENELVLLNDKLVANNLSDSTTTKYGVPTIPSQKLFKESYDKLSSDDKSISDFIEDVISADLYKLSGQYEGTKADVEISCNTISNLIGSISADISNAITSDVKHLDDLQISAAQISSKINNLCTQISNDLTAKYSWLSGEANRLCTELSDNVESKFVHKAGDNINWLSVANGLSTTSFKSFIPGKDIPNKQFTEVVVDENGFKVDAIGQGRQIVLSTDYSTNDIIINGSSLSDHIKSEVRISADEAIRLANTYTDAQIQELVFEDTIADHEFVVGVNEENGKIAVARRKLLSTDIPTISETLVENLTSDLKNLSNNYVAKSDFTTKLINNDGKFLSGGDFKFEYNDQTHVIWLSAGEYPLSIDSTDFIKNRIVHHTGIIEYDGKKWLRLYWTEDEKQFVDISITDLVQVYKFNDGLLTSYVDNKWQVDIDDTIARTTYADAISSHTNTISASLQAEVKRAKEAEEANTTVINTEIARAEGVEGSLQTQINSVSTDLRAEVEARENADSKITTNVNAVSSDVISLKTYATELSGSSPDNIGIIATLSNDISSLQIDAIKELKFDGHMTIYSEITAKTIPELFKQLNLGYDTNYVKNGSVYDITFDGIPTSCSYDLDVMKLGDGNYFIVHDHENKPFVKINDLNAENCYLIKAGVSRYVFETAYNWLSDQTDRLCSEISNDVVAKYKKLSNEIITVSNDIDGTGIYNQLSVIKIDKDEFDELVASDNTILSGNTLYIVDSDYIDVYGQVLCNLVMTDDNVPTDAANKHYVDEKDTALATDIKSVSSSVEVIKNKFNADTIATDPVLKKLLEDKNDSNISTVISAVMYIYNTLAQV